MGVGWASQCEALVVRGLVHSRPNVGLPSPLIEACSIRAGSAMSTNVNRLQIGGRLCTSHHHRSCPADLKHHELNLSKLSQLIAYVLLHVTPEA
jgi:hypothetical protein